MATVTKKQVLTEQQFGGVPYGNKTSLPFTFETNSSGAMVNSDQTTAVLTTDKVRFGVLPAGFRIEDSLAIVSDAFTATSTAKIGFEYVDGVDSTAVPQDDDYFHAALAWSSQLRTRANNLAVRPITLPKDAYLTIVVGTAALDAAGKLDLLVQGVLNGAP